MIWKKPLYYCLALAAICLLACNKPHCKNNNPILQQNTTGSRAYTDELLKQIERLSPAKTSFWLDSFQEINHVKMLHLSVQGEGLCAKMQVIIQQAITGIEGIIQTKGKSYSGAELKGLEYTVEKSENSNTFIFNKITAIID